MEKIIRFTKTCPFPATKKVDGKDVKMLFELSMYTIKRDYYAQSTYKGKIVRDYVEIDAYGLLVTEIFEKGDTIELGEPIDLGVKTSHPRHISAFIHEVCRAPITDVNAIKDLYDEEAASDVWCSGWPDALAQAAAVQLSRNLSTTDLPPFTKSVRKKRNKLLKKLNPFRDLPDHHSNKNGGFDA